MEGKEQIEQMIEEEDKVIHMIETNQVTEERVTDHNEAAAAAEVKADQNQTIGGGRVEERQIDSSKILQQGSKKTFKARVTIPEPFCLATERRMSRERRGSVDFTDNHPTISKLGSFNYKALSGTSSGAERSDLRGAKAAKPTATRTKPGLPPKATAGEAINQKVEKQNGPKTEDKIKGKEIEKKKPQLDAKKQEGGEMERKKIQKSASFRALPLPSFYQQKNPPSRTDMKKITASRSPLIGQGSKPVEKPGEGKGKMLRRTLSSSAKETLNKQVKTTRKPLVTTPNEKVVKGVVVSTA